MDGGAWWATVHAFVRSRTRLKRLSAHPGRGPVVSVCGTLTSVASPDRLDSLISPGLRVEVDLRPWFPKGTKNAFPLFLLLLPSGKDEDHAPNKPRLKQTCCSESCLHCGPDAGAGRSLSALPPPGWASAGLESLKRVLPDLASFTGLDVSFLMGEGNQDQMLTMPSGGSLETST